MRSLENKLKTMQEIELKFLDIDVSEIKEKLEKIWAKLIFEDFIESYNFLKEGFSERDSSQKYLRVRKTNWKVEVTFKWPAWKSEMTSREEVEFLSNDYEKTILLFEKLWFKKWKVFKKHRIHYEKGDIHFELDTLENIPTYLEIEVKKEQDMIDICKKLGLDINDGKKWTIVEILPEKFIKSFEKIK